MLRRLLIFALLGIAALAVAWLASQPGAVTVLWQDQTISFHPALLLAAAFLAAGLPLVLYGLYVALRYRTGLFGNGRRLRAERRARALAARALGLVAAGRAEDAAIAARQAEAVAPDDPLTLLATARTAPDADALVATVGRLIASEGGRLLGQIEGARLAGARGRDAQALDWLSTAARENPAAAPVWKQLLAAQVRAGRLDDALESARNHAALDTADPAASARLTAALATAAAGTLDTEAAEKALERAVKADPGFAPAVIALAARQVARGRTGRAERLIEDAWALKPHPGLAEAYGALAPIETGAQRLRRFERLALRRPDATESRLLLAETALESGEALQALETLAPALTGAVRQRSALLAMEAHRRLGMTPSPAAAWPLAVDHGRPEPQWRCTACGASASLWALVCAGCQGVGTLDWPAD